MISKLKENVEVLAFFLGLPGMFFAAWTFIASYYEKPFEEFVAENSGKSSAINAPVEPGETLHIRWSWAKMPNVPYCYEYHIHSSSSYERIIPGNCIYDAFAFSGKPSGYYFNSSSGILIPWDIPDGEYFIAYVHFPQDVFHKERRKHYKFELIPFEVKKTK